MRLHYVFDRLLPSKMTDSEQAMQTVAALARHGIDVTLVLPRDTSAARQSESSVRDYYNVQGDFRIEWLDVPLARVELWRKHAHAQRAARELLMRARDTVIYTRNMTMLFEAARVAHRVVYETYRPWPDQLPLLRGRFREAMSGEHFVGAVLHSTYTKQCYERLGVEREALLVAHNGVDFSRITPRLSKDDARRALGLPVGQPLVVYTGHVNLTKGVESVVRIARRCRGSRFLMVGGQSRLLAALVHGLASNVDVVPWQPFDAVVRYLYAADVLLVPPSSVPLRVVGNTVLPMKLFLYMAAGRPILAPDSPDVAEVLEDGRNALLVPNGDASAAAAAIGRLLADSALAERLARTAAECSLAFTWDARARKIAGFLEARLEGDRAGQSHPGSEVAPTRP